MAKLKNVSGEVVNLGSPDGKRIEVGEVVDFEGTVSKDSPEDAYLIGEGDDARLYPKSQWQATGGKAKSDDGASADAG